ncbi:Transglutaminase-like superfamily protein [Caloramator quimbayensis]|uniref:Transglutaminase-like superfamily protein n=1 Tax=Caloramator quimbayensis TaxID=1147123 RepID=A0A1T4WPB9_9CLOT|nr:transglutaminase domain-containing protein [Caloramator quimbayensis]SKA79200.1 Transglutaminase-like superfamily protein [Caloramator quimbayensis]
MKLKKTAAILVSFIIIFSLININTNAAKFTLPKGVIVVNNYSQFYSQIKSAVSGRKTSIILYVKKFNSTYDVQKAINQAQYDCFYKNYIVSSWGYKYVSNNKSRLLYVTLNYSNVDGWAKSYDELKSIIKKNIVKRPDILRIKVLTNNAEIEQKKLLVIDDLSKELNGENYIGSFQINISGLSNSKVKVYNYKLNYKEQDIKESLLKSDNIISLASRNDKEADSSVLTNEDEISSSLKKSIINCDDTLKLIITKGYMNNDLKAIMNRIFDLVNKIVQEDMDLSYINNISIESSYNETSNINLNIKFDYNYPRETILNQQSEVNKKAKEIIDSIIKADMTDFQKELAIHDYIINNTRYDEENYYNGSIPWESYTSYGALIKGVAVCQGYASAMSKLLNLAGIENMIITGKANGEAHAWNLVKLDGEWYHVDVTWDDPIFYKNGNKVDTIRYDYFNITDSQMMKDHTWDIDMYPKCTETKYRYDN